MNNKKSTKRALLSSVLSLVLCMAMLIGTTFAWFTDNVTSGKNQIVAGNLDMSVEYSLDGVTWNDLEGASDLFQKGLWEPGHTEVVALRIKNLGTLDFKYNVSMNITSEVAGTNVDDETFKLSDILTVSTYAMDGGAIGDALIGSVFTSEKGLGYNNVVPFKSASVLANDMPVLTGEVGSYLAIKVDMPETVGNEANYKTGTQAPSIDFGINVVATQCVSERDTFGPDYDKDATYPEIESVKANVAPLANLTVPVTGIEGMDEVELNVGYQFEPSETYEEAQESEYKYWHADFVVKADHDVPAKSMALAGYYSLYCDDVTGGDWVALTSPDTITAGQEVRLVQAMGQGQISVNYEEICLYGNDGKGFQCGAVDLTGENAGTTITVELRLYETEAPSAENGNSTNVEVGPNNYIVIGSYSFTF